MFQVINRSEAHELREQARSRYVLPFDVYLTLQHPDHGRHGGPKLGHFLGAEETDLQIPTGLLGIAVFTHRLVDQPRELPLFEQSPGLKQ